MKPRLPLSRACGALTAAFVAGAATLAAPVLAAEGRVEPVSVRAAAHFDFARANLRARDQPAILADVGKMKDVTWQTITTTGHTDSTGSPAGNARLAAQRARAVKNYLVGKGLEPSMIRTVGRASEDPVADDSTPEGRAKNRRTDIVFEGVRAAP